jgi:hypothetical protein
VHVSTDIVLSRYTYLAALVTCNLNWHLWHRHNALPSLVGPVIAQSPNTATGTGTRVFEQRSAGLPHGRHSSWHLEPGTRHLAPWHTALGTWHLAPCHLAPWNLPTWHPAPGTRHLALDTRHLAPWHTSLGTWHPVPQHSSWQLARANTAQVARPTAHITQARTLA